MLSIDNEYDEAGVREFDMRLRKLLEPGETVEYFCEYKVDGVALSLIYERGSLVQGVTRGDGRPGRRRHPQRPHHSGNPPRLRAKNPPELLEVRGETYISNTDFAHLRARQVEAGRKAVRQSAQRGGRGRRSCSTRRSAPPQCGFYAPQRRGDFGIAVRNPGGIPAGGRRLGVPVTPEFRVFADIAAAIEYCHELMEEMPGLDFEVDGFVIKVNNSRNGNGWARPRNFPVGWWRTNSRSTKGSAGSTQIDVHVGKTGTLTPWRIC